MNCRSDPEGEIPDGKKELNMKKCGSKFYVQLDRLTSYIPRWRPFNSVQNAYSIQDRDAC